MGGRGNIQKHRAFNAITDRRKIMTKPTEKEEREALATFGQAARSDDKMPSDERTAENSAKSGNLKSEQKDAADILSGNATEDKPKVDAAIEHEARTDKRSGA
jgi:hypothetical protein